MWKEQDNQLQATLQFQNFSSAWAFLTEVAMAAEKINHHPDWRNVYNRVEITLSTHDAGNIVTEKDRQLATVIEHIFQKYVG